VCTYVCYNVHYEHIFYSTVCQAHWCDCAYALALGAGRSVILNMETLSPEQELVQALLAIVHCFAAQLSGLRNYRKALKKALSDAARPQNPPQSDA
jgi:predicted site-specific integrase-resolvase